MGRRRWLGRGAGSGAPFVPRIGGHPPMRDLAAAGGTEAWKTAPLRRRPPLGNSTPKYAPRSPRRHTNGSGGEVGNTATYQAPRRQASGALVLVDDVDDIRCQSAGCGPDLNDPDEDKQDDRVLLLSFLVTALWSTWVRHEPCAST